MSDLKRQGVPLATATARAESERIVRVRRTADGRISMLATWQPHRAGEAGYCSCCQGPAPVGVVVCARPKRGKPDLDTQPHHFFCAECAAAIGAAVRT